MILSKASVVGSPSRFGAWLRRLSAALAVVVCASGTASAQFYTFDAITNNKPGDVGILESQLSVTVSGVEGESYVDFTFRNVGSSPSSITQIYFDDGTLLDLGSIVEGPGTDFKLANNQPGNLPGGNPINFNPTKGLSIEPDPTGGTQPNGINPGEFLTVRYTLQSTSLDYLDTIAAIELSLANPGVDVEGGLRIGIHVQGFDGGGSESGINGPPTVPEPASIAMLGFSSLVGLGYAWRRRGRVVA